MTAPTAPPPLDDDGALQALSVATTGNQNIAARPDLAGALASGNATAAQSAQANAFVGGLQAEKALAQVRAGGQKVVLPSTMTSALDAIGVNYADVQMSQEELSTKITAAGMVPVSFDSQIVGARPKTAAEAAAKQPGWFSSPSGLWHHILHNPVTNVIGEAGNLTQAELSSSGTDAVSLDKLFGTETTNEKTATATNAALMTSLGYDPNSEISRLAFEAKGYSRTNLTSVINQYGADKVNQANLYLADPKAFTDNLIASATSSDDAIAKMQILQDPEFNKILTQVNGRSASLGTDVAGTAGLDPIKNPTAYSAVSAGVNFTASWFTDPTVVLGKLTKLAKIAQIGIDGFSDTSRMAQILDKTNKITTALTPWKSSIQRGFQSAVDSGNLIHDGETEMAAAREAGDLKAYAAGQAKSATGYDALRKVGLQELAPALVGTQKVTGIAKDGTLLTEAGDRLDTYDKLFEYVTNTHGMLALRSGKAGVESTLMPGALSRFGALRVRTAMASATDANRIDWNLNKLQMASRLLPNATDAVDVATGDIIAADEHGEEAATGLASQARGLSNGDVFPTPAQLGQAEYNLRRYGNFSGADGGGLGAALGKIEVHVPFTNMTLTPGSWINPAAVTARAQQVRQRLTMSNVLPRNGQIDLTDEQAPSKVLAFARLYLPQEQSSILAASFAAGDLGTRRAIFQGMKAQVFHAAGLGHTEAGRDIMEKFLSDDAQVYTHSQDGVMDFDPWTQERDVDTAIWNAQNRTIYSIPGFGQLHYAAAKSGLYESTAGRFLTSHIADSIGRKLRFGMLATPRTAVRATVEGWVNMLARGDAARALAAKAIMADNGMLPKRIALLDKATSWAIPHLVGRYIHTLEKRGMTDQEAGFLNRVATQYPDLAKQVQESLGDHLLTGDVNPISASKDALEIAQAGFKPAPLQYEQSGWTARSTAGQVGAQRLEAALKLRESGNPQTFQAILNHLADPTEDGESRRKVIDALMSPDEYEGFRRSRWSTVYRDDSGVPQRAVDDADKALALHQHADRMTSDLRNLLTGHPVGEERDPETGEITQAGTPGVLNQKLLDKMRSVGPSMTDDEMEQLRSEIQTKEAIHGGLVQDLDSDEGLQGKALQAQISGLKTQLAEAQGYTGGVPNADWINNNLTGPERPVSAVSPEFAPKVVEDQATGIKASYQAVSAAMQDLSGNAYKLMVERPAQRMTSLPAFWANYAKARVETSDLEQQLVDDGGHTAETADRAMMLSAIRQAWVRTEATIDDPGLKTQFDVVGRNLVGFPRAINAFLRRYGELVKNDPTVLRKAVLSIQGAEHAGLVYTDPNGELTYTVPGSGFLANGLNQLASNLHFPGLVRLPIAGDITGKLLLSAPGFDNPIRPSLSPMLNIPFRFISNLFPDHREMLAEIDNVLNGSQGANRSTISQLTPAALSHWWEALDPHESNNLFASSVIGAYSNLRAYDPNGDKGIFPKDGTDPTGEQMQTTLTHIKTQVRNQLFLRAAMGMWLPGAPSRPTDATPASKPDEAYMLRGAQSMSDEYKMILNDNGGDVATASQAFLTAHPNGLVYTMPTTSVTLAHSDIPATRQSEQWMESNVDMIQKYPLVAAYFAPQATGNFDANAWAAQLDLGLRQKKSITDFVNSYELNVAQTAYFQAYDQMKTAQTDATNAGDKSRAAFLATDFNQQMAPFVAAHPLLQQYLTLDTSEAAQNSRIGIQQLSELLATPAGTNLPDSDAAGQMLDAWNSHEAYQTNKTGYSAADRTLETKSFGAFMQGVLTARPQMAGLYDMFRALDTSALPSAYTILQSGGA